MSWKSASRKAEEEYVYIRNRARARGLYRSPFFPKNPTEYTAHLLACREAEAKKLIKKIKGATALKEAGAASQLQTWRLARAVRVKKDIIEEHVRLVRNIETEVQRALASSESGALLRATDSDKIEALMMEKIRLNAVQRATLALAQVMASKDVVNLEKEWREDITRPGFLNDWNLDDKEPIGWIAVPVIDTTRSWLSKKSPVFTDTLARLTNSIIQCVPDPRLAADDDQFLTQPDGTGFLLRFTEEELVAAEDVAQREYKEQQRNPREQNARSMKWIIPAIWRDDDTAMDVALRQFSDTTLDSDGAVSIPEDQNTLFDPTADPNDRYKLSWGIKAGHAFRFWKGPSWEKSPGKGPEGPSQLATQTASNNSKKALRSKPRSNRLVAPLFDGRLPTDGLSTVFGATNPFSAGMAATPTSKGSEGVTWPTLAELWHEGDERVAGRYQAFGRYLPLPRRNAVDPRLADTADAEALRPGDRIPWALRTAVGDRWDLHEDMRCGDRSRLCETEEIGWEEAPAGVRALLEEIREMD